MADEVDVFVEACGRGDVETLRRMLAGNPNLARAASAKGYGGWTGLHAAAKSGHLEAVRLLLQHGADPNARETGDRTYPLHWAAAHRHVDVVRALLDAGGDVHGVGDVHEADAIGWATSPHDPDHARADNAAVVSLLVERGARHHIFSAMNVGDLNLIRSVVRENPAALQRRMSKFESGQTPLHLAMTLERPDMLDLLVELGADLEAKDANGLTALETAMLAGKHDAMRRLIAAGAKLPAIAAGAGSRSSIAELFGTVQKTIPMIFVPDVAAALEWYTAIGFRELDRVADEGLVNWGLVQIGDAQVMLSMHGKNDRQTASLWFYTEKVDELYQRFKARQLEVATAALAGTAPEHPSVEFVAHLYKPFYGGREFGIRDLNGFELWFRWGR